MEDRNDGGAAYPTMFEGGSNSGESPYFEKGMTLRDWFAGNVVGSMFSLVQGAKDEDEAAMMCARMAYKTADAMLEARK